MQRVSFFDRTNWNSRGSRTSALTESEARRRHAARTPYGARVELASGACQIEFYFGAAYCAVIFENDHGKPILEHAFAQPVDDRLFLFQIKRLEEDPRSHTQIATEIRTFTATGATVVLHSSAASDSGFSEETFTDVAEHWRLCPRFGDFGVLVERDSKYLQQYGIPDH